MGTTSKARLGASAALAIAFALPAAADARPAATITSGPSGTIANTSASFTFEAARPARFRCRLDGARVTACSSPASFTGLTAGTHRFVVRAVRRTPERQPAAAVARKASPTGTAKRKFKVQPPADPAPTEP